MIISHKHKFIFFHSQKTGGTSITDAIFPHLGEEDEVIGYNKYKKNSESSLYKHSSCLTVHKSMDIDVYRDYFKFAFVRNPYDLFVSLYHWWQKTPSWDDTSLLQTRLSKIENFEKFCRRYKQHKKPYNFLYDDYLFNRQYKYFFFDDTPLCNFIGRYETLQEDYDKICKIIEMPPSTLKRLNTSERETDYRVYYNENCIKYVKRKYRKELKTFNYKF